MCRQSRPRRCRSGWHARGVTKALYGNVETQASGDSEPRVPARRWTRLGEEKPCEEHTAWVKTMLAKPSSAEVASREATHCPFRRWCKVCVAASARDDPHPRRMHRDEESGLTMVAMDYDILEEKVTVLEAKDDSSGATLA